MFGCGDVSDWRSLRLEPVSVSKLFGVCRIVCNSAACACSRPSQNRASLHKCVAVRHVSCPHPSNLPRPCWRWLACTLSRPADGVRPLAIPARLWPWRPRRLIHPSSSRCARGRRVHVRLYRLHASQPLMACEGLVFAATSIPLQGCCSVSGVKRGRGLAALFGTRWGLWEWAGLASMAAPKGGGASADTGRAIGWEGGQAVEPGRFWSQFSGVYRVAGTWFWSQFSRVAVRGRS